MAIELLGRWHVADNTGDELGHWQLRRRLLGLYGLHVVSLPLAVVQGGEVAAHLPQLLAGCAPRK